MGRLWLTGTVEIQSQKQCPKSSWRAFFRSTAAARAMGAKNSGSWVAARPAPAFDRELWREPLKHWTALAAAGVIVTAAFVPAKAADISGAGATFPYPIYAKWADA